MGLLRFEWLLTEMLHDFVHFLVPKRNESSPVPWVFANDHTLQSPVKVLNTIT